ncbi:MAG: DUF3307 domain-containing protein [bacterium]|nr:DUF3307 domain-containing protein [bacterium]
MEALFIRMILGHLAGDYLFQSKAMALHKGDRGRRGWGWCLLHCAIYTFAVCLLSWKADPLFVLLVFLSHAPIDRWSLAHHWLVFIRGRNMFAAIVSSEPYRELDVGFSCFVYAVTDNTMHALLLFGIAHLFS